MTTLFTWLESHQHLLFWAGLISFVVFVLSLLSLPWLVRALALVGKNVIGYGLILAGILMLFLPGQGILTLVTGLLLVDYPGKFRLERKIVTTPAVLESLNWLRKKANKPPLLTPH